MVIKTAVCRAIKMLVRLAERFVAWLYSERNGWRFYVAMWMYAIVTFWILLILPNTFGMMLIDKYGEDFVGAPDQSLPAGLFVYGSNLLLCFVLYLLIVIPFVEIVLPWIAQKYMHRKYGWEAGDL